MFIFVNSYCWKLQLLNNEFQVFESGKKSTSVVFKLFSGWSWWGRCSLFATREPETEGRDTTIEACRWCTAISTIDVFPPWASTDRICLLYGGRFTDRHIGCNTRQVCSLSRLAFVYNKKKDYAVALHASHYTIVYLLHPLSSCIDYL